MWTTRTTNQEETYVSRSLAVLEARKYNKLHISWILLVVSCGSALEAQDDHVEQTNGHEYVSRGMNITIYVDLAI